MSERSGKGDSGSRERADRLARQLRENLRRRKAQARARKAAGAGPETTEAGTNPAADPSSSEDET